MKTDHLKSTRIQLRPLTSSDLNPVHDLHSKSAVDEFNTLGIPAAIEETESIIKLWIKQNQQSDLKNQTFVIETFINKDFIGLLGLNLWDKKYSSAEVWYKIHPKYWNNGFATESVNLILDYGFDALNLHRIQAGCAVDNIASIKVLEKVGMVREGRRRQILPLKRGWSDNFEYAILESDTRT